MPGQSKSIRGARRPTSRRPNALFPGNAPQPRPSESLYVQVLPNPTAGVATSPTISQAELHTYLALKEQEKALTELVERLRRTFLERLAEGATIEPGPLTARSTVVVTRRFSFDEIVRLLGQASANSLRERLRPCEQTHLLVKTVDGDARNGPAS